MDSVRRLAAAALDPAALDLAAPPVRDEAIASLGCRQIRAMPPETRWSAEAVQLLLSRARTAELAYVLIG